MVYRKSTLRRSSNHHVCPSVQVDYLKYSGMKGLEDYIEV